MDISPKKTHKWPASTLIVRKTQIRATMRHRPAPVRVTHEKGRRWALARTWRRGDPCAALVGMVTAAVETARRFPEKWKLGLPCDLAILLPGACPEERGIVSPVAVTAWLAIAEAWRQPKGPSTGDEIKKMWYKQALEHYSAINKKEILSFATIGMDPEGVVLSEISRTEKGKYCAIPLICGI